MRKLNRFLSLILFLFFAAGAYNAPAQVPAPAASYCKIELARLAPVTESKPLKAGVKPLDARAESLRETVGQRGLELARQAQNGVVHVDVLSIGAGPFAAIFAANFRGTMLALEATSHAGTFDRGRDSFFINSQESPTQSGNPFPGSPITLKNILKGPGIQTKKVGDDVYTTAAPLGNLTLETFDFAKTPVWFNVKAGPVERVGDHLEVTASNGLKIIAKNVIIGGQGKAQVNLLKPAEAAYLKGLGIEDHTADLYEADLKSTGAFRRVITSDDVLNAPTLDSVVPAGKSVLVTGDSHGAFSALIKLVKQGKAGKIYWAGKRVPESAAQEREIYHPVVEAVNEGKIIPIQSQVLATVPHPGSSQVDVVLIKPGNVFKPETITVDQQVTAIGYASNLKEFISPSILQAKPRPEIVMAQLPPLTGIDVPSKVPVGLSIDHIFPVGPRLLNEFKSVAATFVPEPILEGRIGTIIDLMGRQAAALADALSTKARTVVSSTSSPVKYTAENHFLTILSPGAPVSETTWAATLDLQKSVGELLKDKKIEGHSSQLTLTFSQEGKVLIATSQLQGTSISGLELPGLESLIRSVNFQKSFATLADGQNIVVNVPIVDGVPVLHALRIETTAAGAGAGIRSASAAPAQLRAAGQ